MAKKRFADWDPAAVEVLGVIPPVAPPPLETRASDGARFTDWTAQAIRLEDAVVGEELNLGSVPAGAVQYAENKVTAYFSADGRPASPTLATWAKVWTRVGAETRLAIVALSAERPLPSATAIIPEGA